MIVKFTLKTFGMLMFDLDPAFVSDFLLHEHLAVGNYPEAEVVTALPHLIKEGQVAIDAGANIGIHTMLMSRLVGLAGKVVAIEPDPVCAVKLRRNLELNECANVEIVERALAAQPGKRTLFLSSDRGSNSLYHMAEGEKGVGSPDGKIVVDCISPRDIPHLGDAVFMKMDIEGAEPEVMTAMGDSRPVALISEVNEAALARTGETPDSFIRRPLFDDAFVLNEHVMPALIHWGQTIKTTKVNANVLFTPSWHFVACWPEVIL
jgi:FkbM family methyltransferase